MTRDELSALVAEQPTVPILTALAAIGVSETAGRKAHARGELPFRVITVGTRQRVPSCDLEALLLTPNNSETGPATGPALALNNEPSEARDDQECAPAISLRNVASG